MTPKEKGKRGKIQKQPMRRRRKGETRERSPTLAKRKRKRRAGMVSTMRMTTKMMVVVRAKNTDTSKLIACANKDKTQIDVAMIIYMIERRKNSRKGEITMTQRKGRGKGAKERIGPFGSSCPSSFSSQRRQLSLTFEECG